MRPGTRRLLSFLYIPLAIYLGLLFLLFLFQGKMLFIASQDMYRTPAEKGWAYEDVTVPVGEHETHGWWIPAEGDALGVMLFAHGNAGNIADRLESIEIFRTMGFDVLAYDYGGYGNSTGKPSEQRCYADIRAMWGWLTDTKGVPPERIVLMGRSLGAGSTVQLATEVDAGAMIVESAFLSVPKMAQKIYPIFPGMFLARHKFDNESKVGDIRCPTIFVHSQTDSIIPYEHGRQLYELAPEPKAFLEIYGDHNEGFWSSRDVYTGGLLEFLRPLLEN